MTTTTAPPPPPEKTEPLEGLLVWPPPLLPTNTLSMYVTIETLQLCAHGTMFGVGVGSFHPMLWMQPERVSRL